jgi:histidinol-phosphate/aromatic aminotransferase/cobyric acid decarboxylase-like protein
MVKVSAPSLLVAEPSTPDLPRDYVVKNLGISLDDVAKLGSAEIQFGPPPKAAAAVDEARVDVYSDWTAMALRTAICERLSASPDKIHARPASEPIGMNFAHWLA